LKPKVKVLVKWYKPSTWFSKWKYELLEKWGYQTWITGYYIKTEYVTLRKNGWIIFEKGYRWDGASGPTWDNEEYRRDPLVHDGFYQLLRTGKLPQKYKDDADNLLYKMLIEDGMSRFRAGYWYLGVRLFGANSCKVTK
jgi:hypothetical protein